MFSIKLKVINILIICFACFTLYSQNSYILTDTLSSFGIKLAPGTDIENSNFISVRTSKDILVKYTPHQVSEYGLKDGRVYFSKEIFMDNISRKVFLERLTQGKTSLFYYRDKGIKTFYIEKENKLYQLPRKNEENVSFDNQLMSLTANCPGIEYAVKFVSYNKRSLTQLISRYNDCIVKPFPHFRFGLVFGYELAKLIPATNTGQVNSFDFHFDGSPMVGLFLDNPIFGSDFSLHSEFYYVKHGYSYNRFTNYTDFDFVANISSLRIPILLRYSVPSKKINPFINLGAVLNYNIRNEIMHFITKTSGYKIIIENVQSSELLSKSQIGYSIGAGAEFKITYKNSLFFEIGYTRLYSNSILKPAIINLQSAINF